MNQFSPPADLHKLYEELKMRAPQDAKRLKDQNPGVGCVWAFPDVPGSNPFLVDPDTGRCVRDSFQRPIVAQGMTPPFNPSGVNPPPVHRSMNASVQTFGLDPSSVSRALKVNAQPNFELQRTGLSVIQHNRKVTVYAPRPVVLTVEEAQATGLIALHEPINVDTFFTEHEAGPYVRAALAPFFETIADVLEAFVASVNNTLTLGKDRSAKIILDLPNAGTWTSSHPILNPSTARYTLRIHGRDRLRFNEIVDIIRQAGVPPQAVSLTNMNDHVLVKFVETTSFSVPDEYRSTIWKIALPTFKDPLPAPQQLHWLRAQSTITQQQIDQNPALLVVYGIAKTARDALLVAAFPQRGVAMGVADILRLGVSLSQADDATDVVEAVLKALVSESLARAARRFMDTLDKAKLGKSAQPAVDAASNVVEQALGNIVEWGREEILRDR
jgi:hypothetical protein